MRRLPCPREVLVCSFLILTQQATENEMLLGESNSLNADLSKASTFLTSNF